MPYITIAAQSNVEASEPTTILTNAADREQWLECIPDDLDAYEKATGIVAKSTPTPQHDELMDPRTFTALVDWLRENDFLGGECDTPEAFTALIEAEDAAGAAHLRDSRNVPTDAQMAAMARELAKETLAKDEQEFLHIALHNIIEANPDHPAAWSLHRKLADAAGITVRGQLEAALVIIENDDHADEHAQWIRDTRALLIPRPPAMTQADAKLTTTPVCAFNPASPPYARFDYFQTVAQAKAAPKAYERIWTLDRATGMWR